MAEVLVTLGVIAVVAVMVIPGVMAKYTERVKASRIENIHHKISQAMDKMLVLRGINDYPSTRAFVEELKNHLSIVQVCENDNLEACWPTKKVLLNDEGKEWSIANTTVAGNLRMPKKDSYNDWDNTIGITTADGLQMIISYNKRCAIDPNQSPIWNSNISTTTSCVAGIFDWNGGKRPNKFGDDVMSFHANGLGQACVAEIGKKCFGAQVIPSPMTKADCETAVVEGKLGIKSCSYDIDYWAGAVKHCGGVNNLPTPSDLSEFAKTIYEDNPDPMGTMSSLNLPEPTFIVWTNNEARSYYSTIRRFFDSYTTTTDHRRDDGSIYVFCVSED